MWQFPDSCNYRIEVSGMETPYILKETIKAFRKAGIPFHRGICTVRGAGALRKNPMADNKQLYGFYTGEELKEMAKIGANEGVELIMTPFSRPLYRQMNAKGQNNETGTLQNQTTSEQGRCGLSWRGDLGVAEYLEDILALYDLGFRGFLVWRKGMLMQLISMSYLSKLPKDIVLKLSVFDDNANIFDAHLVNYLRKNYPNNCNKPVLDITMNPATDLTVEMLSQIRAEIDNMPMDIHCPIFDSWGTNNRIDEAYEVVKAASPCYFKNEFGPGLEMYAPDYPQEKLLEYKLAAVPMAQRIIYNVNEGNAKFSTNFRVSDWTPEDLHLPVI